jgi:hypothetical protein
MRFIHKARKTQHQNPEFGHTQGEIFMKPTSKGYAINTYLCNQQ